MNAANQFQTRQQRPAARSVVHEAESGGSYSLLLVNFAQETTTVALPAHTSRSEYVLSSGDGGLLSKETVLNDGDVLTAAADGTLPPLDGRQVDGSVEKFVVPAESVAFVVMDGLADDPGICL